MLALSGILIAISAAFSAVAFAGYAATGNLIDLGSGVFAAVCALISALFVAASLWR